MRRRAPAAPDQGPPPRADRRRWIRRGVLGILALPLAWLLLINLSLWTGLVEALVRGERPRSTLRLEHGWAWCVWPTVVHVHDLHLAIDGPRWQLDLRVPRGELDVSLLELMERRFQVNSLVAEGAALAFAIKRPHGADPRELEGFPRIAGLPPPVMDPEPRPIPAEDEAWEVDLSGLDVGLARLHVQAIEADLGARLRGALEVRVAHRLAIPAVHVAVDEATIRRGEAVIAEGVAGAIDLELAAYDPQETRGRALLRGLSGELRGDAQLPGLAWLADVGVEVPATIRGGAGSLSAAIGLRQGVLTPGSRARYEAAKIELRRDREGDAEGDAEGDPGGPLSVRGRAEVEAAVPQAGGGPRVTAVMRSIAAGDGDGDAPWLAAERLDLDLALASADLARGLGPVTSASVELPSFTADLGDLSRLADAGLRAGHLAGRASARSGDEPGVYAVDFAVDVDGLVVRRDDLSLRGDGYVRSSGTLRRGDGGGLDTIALEPLHAQLRGLEIESERGTTEGGWVEVDRAGVRYDRGASRLRVDARGRLANLRIVVAHLRPGDDLLERVPSLDLGQHAVDFSLTLTRTPGSLRIDVDRLESGPVDLVAAFARAGEARRGAVLFQDLRLGVVTVGDGSRRIDLAVDPGWFEEKATWVRAVGSAKAAR